jgi:hypothetical protein
VLPPTLGRAETYRPYFEVLIVRGAPAARRRQRQRQESNNLRPALGGVLHGDDDAPRTCDEVHRTNHPRHHLCPGPAVVERNVAAKTIRTCRWGIGVPFEGVFFSAPPIIIPRCSSVTEGERSHPISGIFTSTAKKRRSVFAACGDAGLTLRVPVSSRG